MYIVHVLNTHNEQQSLLNNGNVSFIKLHVHVHVSFCRFELMRSNHVFLIIVITCTCKVYINYVSK